MDETAGIRESGAPQVESLRMWLFVGYLVLLVSASAGALVLEAGPTPLGDIVLSVVLAAVGVAGAVLYWRVRSLGSQRWLPPFVVLAFTSAVAASLSGHLLLAVSVACLIGMSSLALVYVRGRVAKAATAVLCVLIGLGLTPVVGLLTLSSAMAQTQRISQAQDPSHGLVMAVDSVDHGGHGGETLVVIERQYTALLATNVSTVWRGQWDSRPAVGWLDDHTVVVNGQQLDIGSDIYEDLPPSQEQ